ncbi:sensor histidine kinase [Arcobacter sp. LA11]|uniref:sensor histidine kinase n=1 Tax=Arcobacter sp. LA11 TaxID=1898176 RepID=UPI0009348B41|nr:HAMP domain-containing sensor histidine kinase [Arcobacter sp. LA11]
MDQELINNIKARLDKKNSVLEIKDIQTITQELDIYHTELITQNEELYSTNQELSKLKEELRSIFNYSPICYFTIDKDFKIIDSNLLAKEYFDINKRIKTFFHLVENSSKTNFLDWINLKEFLKKDLEVFLKCVDSESKRFRLKAIPYPSKGEIYFLSIIDIDEEYKFKENLKQKVEEEVAKNIFNQKILQEKSKLASMGELIDIIAHQWASPLTNIRVQADLLKRDYKKNRVNGEYVEDYSGKIKNNIDHLISTLREFRNFLRPNENLERVNLIKLVSSVKILLKDTLIAKRVRLSMDVDESIHINVYINELINVFVNLITNAIEAHQENHTRNRYVNISATEENNSVKIHVKDNAGGISKRTLKKIFEKEFTTKEEGTGIGLYLVKAILEKINSSIEARSKENETEFLITINTVQ